MRTRSQLLAIGLLGAATVAAAQAPADSAERLARLDPPTRAAVLAIVDTARLRGLPSEPLIEKALEGATKGATGPRIAQAVRTLSVHLMTARGALGAAATEPELVAGAAVLRSGVPPTRLEELRQSARRERLGVPLAVLSDLLARGVPVDTATRVIQGMVAANIADEAFLRLGREVDRDVRAGAAPGTSAWVRGGAPMGRGGPGPAGPGGPPGRPHGPGGKPPGDRPPPP